MFPRVHYFPADDCSCFPTRYQEDGSQKMPGRQSLSELAGLQGSVRDSQGHNNFQGATNGEQA